MAAPKWTDEQKAEALSIGRSAGWAEAERQTGVPRATIASWARRASPPVATSVAVPPALEAAQETASLASEARRHRLADGLLDDVDRLRTRLFSPMDYVHVKVLNVGKIGEDEGGTLVKFQEVKTVHVELDQPVPADQLRLAQSIVALIEKAQLLVGEATSRDDTGGLDLMAELQQHQAAQSEAAAIARAQAAL